MFIECFIKIYSTYTKPADPSLLGVYTPYVGGDLQSKQTPPLHTYHLLHCLADL